MQMRKILICLSFWVFLFSSLPVLAAQVEPLDGIAVVTSEKLNVRRGPSKEYAVIGVLVKDASVDVEGIVEPSWYVIEYQGQQGYIHSNYVIFTPAEEIETALNVVVKQYIIMGLGIVIFLIVGLMTYTALSIYSAKKREEMEQMENDIENDIEDDIENDIEDETEDRIEDEIPITDHADTNMHLGEITYDTYRLDIDPSFFETTTIVPQPESIYEKQEVLDKKEENNIHTLDMKLEQASAQIAALQKEMEELKKQQK